MNFVTVGNMMIIMTPTKIKYGKSEQSVNPIHFQTPSLMIYWPNRNNRETYYFSFDFTYENSRA